MSRQDWLRLARPSPLSRPFATHQAATTRKTLSAIINGKQSVTIQLSGAGRTTYSWRPATFLSNPSIADPTASPDQTGTYQLSVTDQLGCSSIQHATVTVQVTPPAKLSAGDDTSVLRDEPIQLNAIDVNTNLTLEVYTTIGLIVPDAFTPNGDGHNDVLTVIPFGIRQLHYLDIFNRWGQRVFYTTDAGTGWDGTLGGRPQPPGVYVWMVAGIDVKGHSVAQKGTTMLIR